ncbi:MAG: ubiquitin-like small modifier protein 1 [Thermoanaerobaculia bacterium]
MALRFLIPGPLQQFSGERREILVDGAPASLSDALAILWQECPAIRDRVVTETGEVRPHVNIFVDGESARYTGGLDTPLGEESEIAIFPALSGG